MLCSAKSLPNPNVYMHLHMVELARKTSECFTYWEGGWKKCKGHCKSF